ncbi:MAG: undecaprenyl-diphosphate phosphatase [Chloroflexota bacterium]
MSAVQALWLAVLQGFSELFPVSSLGHTVIVPSLVGWSNINQASPTFLPFLVMLHLGTATALLIFFWRDWLAIVTAFVRSAVAGRLSSDANEHLAWMLVFGTIPAGLIGFFLQKPLQRLFASPKTAAAFLIVNGAVLLLGEFIRRRSERPGNRGVFFSSERGKDLDSLTWKGALAVGAAQSLALIPGISRGGVTIVAGLLLDLKHEPAARFSFLLTTPIIAGAGLLEVPVLFGAAGRPVLGVAFVGAVAAGIVAYLSVKFLMRYFEFGRLDPFGFYCLAFGTASLAVLALR